MRIYVSYNLNPQVKLRYQLLLLLFAAAIAMVMVIHTDRQMPVLCGLSICISSSSENKRKIKMWREFYLFTKHGRVIELSEMHYSLFFIINKNKNPILID